MRVDVSNPFSIELIETYWKHKVLIVGVWKLVDLSTGIDSYGVIDYENKKCLDCLDIRHAFYIYSICCEKYGREGFIQ